MHVLGITGGVATGKSAVTQMFADLGAPTISADAIAHDLLSPGTEVNQRVRALFGLSGTADEAINRQELGRIVFANPDARKQLEAITHPQIIARLKEEMDTWRSLPEPPLAAAEIPLLFEAGLESLADHLIVVACAQQTQITRIQERRGITAAEAQRIASAQWPLAEKIARAHFVITTDGSLEETQQQVAALWAKLV